MTWIEVTADAVKIGLGALLGGVFAILAAAMAHKQKLTEEYSKRRRDALEQISDRFDQVAQAGIERAAHMSALSQLKPLKVREEVAGAIASSEGEGISTMEYLLEMHSIEARLALLAFPHIASAIEDYRVLFCQIDPTTTPKTKEAGIYAELEMELQACRTRIFTLMAEAYRKA